MMQTFGHNSAEVHNIYSQGEWNNVRAAIDKLPELAG